MVASIISGINDHDLFMECALNEAESGLRRGEFPVGAVMVLNNRIVSRGARTNSKSGGNELDHAEIVALRILREQLPETNLSEVVVYSTMEPCLMCFSALILNGIRTIVYGYEDVMGGGTSLELSTLPSLYSEMEIDIIPGVCRNQSLENFKQFFLDQNNHYWCGSLLARYTLEQT
jgi:tRNA(adenine34) deaminase